MPQVTTPSLQALRLYANGQELWGEGRWQDAVECWEAALRIDPDFAMARRELGSAYLSHQLHSAPNLGKGEPHLERASRLAWRTTDRERGLIQATHLDKVGRYAEAMPARLRGNLVHDYGFALVAAGQEARAKETFALALAKPEGKASGLRSLAMLDLLHGRYREAAEKLLEGIALWDSHGSALSRARNHLLLSMVRAGQGDAAGARSELDAATRCMPSLPVWLGARVGGRSRPGPWSGWRPPPTRKLRASSGC